MDVRATTMMLCNHAAVHDGMLFIHGGGWTWCGPDPAPHSLAVMIEVPWHRMGETLYFTIDLIDADGGPVLNGDGEMIRVEGELVMNQPNEESGVKPGTPGVIPLALNLGFIELEPDSRYVWRMSINGQIDSSWEAAFNTRPLDAAA